jgi:hypothetical protein
MEQVLSASGRRLSITQSDSYHSLSAKQLTAQQQMVVDCFQSEDAALTREDIASRTNLRLSSVCGRVRELLDARRLVVKGARRCVATGKKHELLAMASR